MSFTLWFTGLPASGKTTISRSVYSFLKEKGMAVELFDSDEFVGYLGRYFDGSPMGRELNNRCMAIVCRYLNLNNIISIVASTSPILEKRNLNRILIGNYIEVYCKCSLETAETRDQKGLYRMARNGEIRNFTGIGAIYEEPLAPEITVDTMSQTVDDCMTLIINYLRITLKINNHPAEQKQKNDCIEYIGEMKHDS